MIAWDEKWPVLRHGDVYPVPLATDTSWTDEGWTVDVVVLTDVTEGGYSAVSVFTYREPYADDRAPDEAEATRVTSAGLGAFAARFREVLGTEEKPKSAFWRG
jgi:hypothetical protein